MTIDHSGRLIKKHLMEELGGISLGKTIPLAITIMMITLSYSVLIPEGRSEEEGYEIQPVWTYDAGDDIRMSSISTDGNFIGVGSGNQFFLFNKESSTPLWIYTANHNIMWFELSDNGEIIVVGTQDSMILLFTKDSSTPVWDFSAGEVIDSVDISGDGNFISAGSTDDHVYLFHKDSSTPLWSYDSGYDITSSAISKNGEYIVAGNKENKVLLFNKQSSTPLWTYVTGDDVLDVGISGNGEYIVAGNRENSIFLFKKDNSTPEWSFQSDGFMTVEISRDGQYLVAASFDKNTYFFSKNSSTPLWNHSANDQVRWTAISANGEYAVSGSDDNNVYYFKTNSSQPLWTYETGDDVWGRLEMSGDGKYVAVPSFDDNFYLFLRKELVLSSSNQTYHPSETVTIDASFHEASTNITFQVKDSDGKNYTIETHETNNTGFATLKFRLREDVLDGRWTVIATNDKDNSSDSITFDVVFNDPPHLILKSMDLPTIIARGEMMIVNFSIENTYSENADVTLVLQLKDGEFTPLEPLIEETIVSRRSTEIHSLTFTVPSDAVTGEYSVQGQVLTELPENAGYAIDFLNTNIDVL